MINIVLDIHEDVFAAVEKIKAVGDYDIQLDIPKGSVLFENVLNLKILKKTAEDLGKDLLFKTTDESGQNLIASLNGTIPAGVSAEFVTKAVAVEDVAAKVSSGGKKFFKPKLMLPSFSFGFLGKLKNFNFGRFVKLLIPIAAVLMAVGVFVYLIAWKVPKAHVKIIVNSQPLIKSFPIKVIDGLETDVEERILKGTVISTSLVDSLKRETTGEKLIGKKAEGEIKIYNKTTSSKEFNKNTKVIYDDGGMEYIYLLKDDVTVPARVDEEPDPLDPDAEPISVWGEVKAEVIANDIGESYNIDKGKSLKFENHDKSNFSANVSDDITGGNSETISVVTEDDRKAVADDLYAKITENIGTALKGELTGSQKMIWGSESISLTSQEFSVEVDAEADEVEVTQTVKAEALVYSSADLDPMLDKLLEEFVPEEYELSSGEREVNVEILGNTDDSVLSTGAADLQVTLKSYIIPLIDEQKIKEELAGKPLSRVERILGSIRNVKTYEIGVSPNIPFFQRFPSSIENINFTVERQ